ncbi:bifunctional hydroxymethylpyrimidine kinase/phosphomethylpyrimidine kinase [Pseudoruegeria sp. SHC-113]|uniref:bifunctional hydroxymethylpyrimidine kinase/phosphomethylpyrimidine kinase n=1 Tax=Pseudoruegeria sp. SHC-113 TaxID=2855439 RepID=UPI0021BB499F|nr:bifunctional hydroxymethylpyrimidine kinase/phosphomethylpyrimidine kinase [Pseudoruegeria sp. SHC-113]MCT8161959.1 bifunctional hydroxymethylpyrimidine kinase/phosphomethylpyrimidine kinase [Pseudoruegeria sp. SHC-113]
MTPIALTIAGSDSGGGAGIQADLKAMSALGVYGASVITAVTAQNTRAVTAVQGIDLPVISAQIEAVLSDLAVDAVKIGMLATPEIIATVADGLKGFKGPIVLDPVMVAKSGDSLLQEDAVAALIERLLPMATVLTPNLPEAARLLGQSEAESRAAMAAQGEALLALGAEAVLMKGGHAKGAVCEDLLITEDAPPLVLTAPRAETQNTHGTGCTLSSSIAAELAKGADLTAAVVAAHGYLQAAIAAADDLQIGSGHGPVHHFHAQWPVYG